METLIDCKEELVIPNSAANFGTAGATIDEAIGLMKV